MLSSWMHMHVGGHTQLNEVANRGSATFVRGDLSMPH